MLIKDLLLLLISSLRECTKCLCENMKKEEIANWNEIKNNFKTSKLNYCNYCPLVPSIYMYKFIKDM